MDEPTVQDYVRRSEEALDKLRELTVQTTESTREGEKSMRVLRVTEAIVYALLAQYPKTYED